MNRGIIGIIMMFFGTLFVMLFDVYLSNAYAIGIARAVLLILGIIGFGALTIFGGIIVAYSGLVQKIGKINLTVE